MSAATNHLTVVAGLRAEPVQRRGHATRTRLLRAALAAIQEKGRDGFTTSDVADGAGVSIGTVYRYFDDRVAILRALFPDIVEGLGEPIDLGEES